MCTLRKIAERVAFALIRLAATGMTVAGIALIVPAFGLMAAGAETAQIAVSDAIRVAAVLLFAGGVSLYLARTQTRWLTDTSRSEASVGSAFSGWLLLFPLTLVSVPLLMLLQLQPLAEFWRDVIALARQLSLWQDLQQNGGASGLVVMPIIAALAVPAFEALVAAGFVVGSILLLTLLLVRSTRIPRALLLFVLVLGSGSVASVIGTRIIERVTPSVELLIRDTPDPTGVEQARATEELQRYRVVTRGASVTLMGAWGVMALWTPLLLVHTRARTVFASQGPSENFSDVALRLDPSR